MKTNKWMQSLIGALFAFMLAISSIGNLISGYKLPIDSMLAIYLLCGIAAVTMAVLFQIRHGGKIILGLAAFVVFCLCVIELIQPHIIDQTRTLFFRITSHYHNIYKWPVLGKELAEDVSSPLILWTFLVTFCVNWYISRRKHIVVAIIPTVIPLSLCLLTTDRVPDILYLYLMIIGLAALFMTDWTRKTQPAHSAKLLLSTVVPIALFFALIFLCNPQASYVNHAGRIQKEMNIWIERFKDTADAVIHGEPINTSGDKKLNLRTVGARSDASRAIMRVNAPVSGIVYLRERDFDVYNGTAWESTADREETFSYGGTSVGTLTITTYGTRANLLIPYYPSSGLALSGGIIENNDNLQRYSYSLSVTVAKKTGTPDAVYKSLPSDTQKWAKELVAQITADAKNDQEKIVKIHDYVRNVAEYNTDTVRMSDEYDDFAQWFLAEAEGGYCIHYATAATVLLRAAGIRARYVEGYIVKGCEPGKNVVVDKLDAHSWVEYYNATTRAWCILETTPIYSQTKDPQNTPGNLLGVSGIPGLPEVNGDGEDITVAIPPEEEEDDLEFPEDEQPEEDEDFTDPTEPEETTPPDEPSGGAVPGQIAGRRPWEMPKWMKTALICMLLACCVPLQGYLRIRRKRKLWDRGEPNARTIRQWKYIRSAANRMHLYYPEELDELALKARFSQHEIQPEELQKFAECRAALLDQLSAMPWYRRIFYKCIFAIG